MQVTSLNGKENVDQTGESLVSDRFFWGGLFLLSMHLSLSFLCVKKVLYFNAGDHSPSVDTPIKQHRRVTLMCCVFKISIFECMKKNIIKELFDIFGTLIFF